MADATPLREIETGNARDTATSARLVLIRLAPEQGTERLYSCSPNLARALASRLIDSAEVAESDRG